MPDVGVLELTIRDNSTTAAGGLNELAGALVSVKNAVKGGLNLSTGPKSVASQVKALADTVKSNNTVIKNLGTLFNAISNFSKLKDIQINTQPIEALKNALSGGLNIGKAGTEINKLREALNGNWGNEQSLNFITTSMTNIATAAQTMASGNTAGAIRDVAKSIDAYVKSIGSVSGGGAHDYLQQQIFSSVSSVNPKELGTNFAAGMAQGIKEYTSAVESAASDMGRAADNAVKTEVQEHSPSQLEYENGVNFVAGFENGIRSKISDVTAAVAEMANAAITSAGSNTQHIADEISSAIRSAFMSGVNNIDLSDSQRAIIQQGIDLASGFAQGFIPNAESSLSDLGGIVSTAITRVMTEASEKAFASSIPLNESVGQLQELIQTTGTAINTNLEEGMRSTTASASELDETIQMTNEELQEQLHIRREIMDAQNQARLENNYPLYRELYMSGEGDWKQQVPEMYGFTPKAIEEAETYAEALKITMKEVNEYVDRFIEQQNQPVGPLLRDTIDQSLGIGRACKEAAASAALLKNAPGIQSTVEGLQQTTSAVQTTTESVKRAKTETRVLTDDLKDLDKELRQKKPDAEKASRGMDSFREVLGDLKKGIQNMFPTLTSLFKSFLRMAKMRAIRYIIRQIAAAFKEGTQNVYEYSKAIGSTFHESMDGAASSLAQMKNAIGAQLAPLLQMLIPVLQRVVNWFINVTNVVNQFFSLLNGQKSWTRALPQTVSAFDKQTKAAKSASAAMKDLLADWDELNIIQSESGGGGGGAGTTAAEDYLNMFEEVYTFDNKIKDTVQWVQDHMEEIKTVAEAIGLSILGWKISEAFGLTLGTLQKLELIGGIILTIASIKLLASAAYDIGKDGINGENALDAVAGVLGTMVGTAVAGFAIGGVVGAAIGLIVGAAISLAVTGINIREGKLDSLYGDVSKDVDDIRKELEENVLTADATMTVNVAQAKIKDVKDAETKVTNAINELNKTYPLGVEITPTNADDFIGKVNALVAADNELLQKSGEVLNLTVPASPQWGNEGDFHTFLDEALGDVSSYVTGIGEEIGKLISQGITKGTKLDELRKQLEEISVAILTAQKSSEFSAAVGIAGATARNMKQYDRKTIENYMTEYATLLQGKMGEAQAQATAEYVELQRTVAAYEELGKNNAEEYDPEVMKQLREELAAWDNGKRVNVRAQELVDEWTAVGRELYKNDILSLLSGNMIKNKNTGWRYSALYGSGSMSQEPINIINSYDDKRKREWADEYIEQGNKILKDIIQSETGINGDVVLNFANASGLSLLDFFDAGFAKEFEDSILKVVSQIDIPQSEKERIYAAFGMDYNNYNVPKEIEEAIVKYSEGGLDTREINQILEHFDITNERLNRYIQILGYENLFGEHYYTERDDTGYLNPDEAEKAMRFIASAGSVSDVGWGQYYPVAQPEQEELTEVDFARAVETGTTNANVNQNMLFEQMISLLGQIAGKDFTVNITPTSTAGAFVNRSIAKFNMIAHD